PSRFTTLDSAKNSASASLPFFRQGPASTLDELMANIAIAAVNVTLPILITPLPPPFEDPQAVRTILLFFFFNLLRKACGTFLVGFSLGIRGLFGGSRPGKRDLIGANPKTFPPCPTSDSSE